MAYFSTADSPEIRAERALPQARLQVGLPAPASELKSSAKSATLPAERVPALDLAGFFWITEPKTQSIIYAMHKARRDTATDAKTRVTAHEQSSKSARP